MKAEEFFAEIESLLELEGELETNAETLIEDVLEVDSLAHITLISFVKDELDVELRVEDFAKLENLNDLINAIGADKFN
jgi:acyl carrier protein